MKVTLILKSHFSYCGVYFWPITYLHDAEWVLDLSASALDGSSVFSCIYCLTESQDVLVRLFDSQLLNWLLHENILTVLTVTQLFHLRDLLNW
jgi:hypothetical protein